MQKYNGCYTARVLTGMAVMTAVTVVLTLVPKIPIPLGYAHLGDVAVFLFAVRSRPGEAGIAVAVGSALADFLGGFPLWILPTLLIKYGMARIVWNMLPRRDIHVLRVFLAFSVSELWMIVGYTFAGALLYGSMEVGLTSTPGLVIEGVVNIIAAVGGYLMLRKTSVFVRSR